MQLYDFRVEGEIPCCVRCHPKQNIFACGFESGRVQLFDMSSSLAEYQLVCLYTIQGVILSHLLTLGIIVESYLDCSSHLQAPNSIPVPVIQLWPCTTLALSSY